MMSARLRVSIAGGCLASVAALVPLGCTRSVSNPPPYAQTSAALTQESPIPEIVITSSRDVHDAARR